MLDQIKSFSGMDSQRDLGRGELPEEVVEVTNERSLRENLGRWKVVKQKLKIFSWSLRERCFDCHSIDRSGYDENLMSACGNFPRPVPTHGTVGSDGGKTVES